MNFSALGCIYSKEKVDFLEASLTSLYKQELKASEVVLVHDGFLTEKLYSCLSRWEKKLPLKQISAKKSFKGKFLSSCLNIGLMHCQYDLVAIFDSDDINRENRFIIQINHMKSKPHISALSSYMSEFLKTPNDLGRIKKAPLSSKEIFKYARIRSPLNHPCAVLRKDHVLALGGYSGEIPFMEDYGLCLKLLANGRLIENIPEILVDYRTSEMILKRKGFFYAFSEILLYKEKKRMRFSNGLHGFFIFILRFFSRLLPIKMLSFVYRFLREKPRNWDI